MASKGHVYKRCGCTQVDEQGRRRQLGKNCPKLKRPDGAWNPRHGTWTFAISVAGRGGERKQVVRGGFATQGDAQAAMDELKGKASRGVDVASRLTTRDYLRTWLAGKKDIKLNTLTSYTGHVDRYFEPIIGHIRLAELRVEHVQEVFDYIDEHNELCTKGRATRPVGLTSVQRIRATLRGALNDAMRQGLISTNPASLIKLKAPKRPKGMVWTDERVRRWEQAVGELREEGLTLRRALASVATPSKVMVWRPDQLGQFLDHAAEDRLYALWHIYAHRGLRRGEACGLEWDEVDLVEGSIHVVRQRISVAGQIVEDTPKSDAGDRTISLGRDTVEVLRAHRQAQRKERMAAGQSWVDSGKVFCQEDGSPLDPNQVSERFETLTMTAGLPPVRLHDLRHGAASLMLAAGVSMKVVQETLGHANMALTANTYTSVYPEVANAAAEAAYALVPRTRRDA
ncbi:site-specific integrase [Pseudonocardia dioxanivorans]|uniref:site-specific integrase n=1 Tax=Pseudonocardia dioxanivorans TaxID=240495 RepID=UPI000CD1E4CE|nr:site-specific integrase [Pseudonocardia dioxanivorans]